MAIRLPYNVTRAFSLKLTVVGSVLLFLASTGVGFASLFIKGKVSSCITEAKPNFEPERCQDSIISIGETLIMPQFTYVVATAFNYSGQVLTCSVNANGLSIYLVSVLAPQFVWSYKIGCTGMNFSANVKPFNLTILGGTGTVLNSSIETTLILDQLTSVVNATGVHYSCGNDSTSDPVTVLRYVDGGSDLFYETYTRTQLCTDYTWSEKLRNISIIVNASIVDDVGSFTIPRSYLCNTCSHRWDKVPRILLEVIQGVGSLFGIIYTLVIFTLSKFSDERDKDQLQYNRGIDRSEQELSTM